MADVHVKIAFTHQSGKPEDTVVNTWNITGLASLVNSTLVDVANAINGFYTELVPNALVSVGSLMSPSLSRAANGIDVSVYDVTGKLDGVTPIGSPLHVQQSNLNAAGVVTAIPAEVALAATLKAQGRDVALVEAPDDADPDAAPERPRQRLTGRIYFGPFTTQVLATDNNVCRPASTIRDTLLAAFDWLDQYLQTETGTGQLAVWSRANAAMVPVDVVTIDNSWDTIRSRGEAPTLTSSVAL